MPEGPSPKRLRALATIAVVNALVIIVSIFSGWTLAEATLAYLGEMVILALLIYVRVLVAKRLPYNQVVDSRWDLIKAKVLAIGVTLPLYGVFAGVVLMLMFGRTILAGKGVPLPESTLRGLMWCWAGFVLAHLTAFFEHYRSGAYKVLISDGRVMAQMVRYPPLLLAGIVAASANEGTPLAPWLSMGALAFMAVVDTATYVAEQDAVNATLRGTLWGE